MSKTSEINKLALSFQDSQKEVHFNKIYDKLYLPILNFSRKYLLNFFKYNPEVAYREAPGICNETFIRVYKKIHQFNPEYQFTTWIYTIAKNLCLQKIRQYQKEKLVSFDFTIPSLAEEGNASAFSFDSDVKLWETTEFEFEDVDEEVIFKEILSHGLQQLTDEYKEILVDCELKEMKYKDIADKYDLNINTVKTKIRRGRKQLEEECDKIKEVYVKRGVLDANAKYN